MKNILNKNYVSSIVVSIIFIILGLLLTIFSNMTLSLVAFVIGIFVIIGSFKYLINYIKDSNSSFDLVCFIVMLILGLVIILKYSFFAGIFPFIIGLVVFINSIGKLQIALELKENNANWISCLVLSIIGLTLGILFIFNPFKGALVITKIIGIYMLVYGIIDLFENIIIKKRFINGVKKIKIIDEK